jgi:UDP-N-acetylmuramoyl-L-alanyl-D-glutamate--2,6-diaminopimelate ligase
MKLAHLLAPWIDSPLPDCYILGLHNDSREIKPGFLFFAYPGTQTDGRRFISRAIEAGASAVLYEPENWDSAEYKPSAGVIPLPGLRNKVGKIASRFYNSPSKKLTITAVTGTNGKTTVAYQLAQAHELLGEAAAYIGTIGQGSVKKLEPLINTTPDALCLQQLLASYVNKSIKQLSMEVSSHGLCQGRVDEIAFQQAIFTNLSHDHMDYHLTMEAYAKAKSLLFARPTLKWVILNRDDPFSSFMEKAIVAPSCQRLGYGVYQKADVKVLNWQADLTGSRCEVTSPWGPFTLETKALGFFNIYNSLAVLTSLLAEGYTLDKVISTIAKLKAAPGRMEIVLHEPYIIVDYAHTPDALENALATLHKVRRKGRIFVVFGCGGDRDKSKRPMMGKIASQYADILIVTSDNPRTEDPSAIIAEITAALPAKTCFYAITDREEAIKKAIDLATLDDIVLIAGKGHEEYQIIGTECYRFSDQAVVRRLTNNEHKSSLDPQQLH